MATFNPAVFDRKSTFMQRIADHARVGYFYWTSGEVPIEKAATLARKFADLYLVGLTKDVRFKRKKLGLGNAVLLLWQGQGDTQTHIQFVLMVSTGDHPAHQLELLQDVRLSRIQVTGYELLQLPRKGQDHPAWTWRMTAEAYELWEFRIEQVTKSRNPRLAAEAFYSLYQSPGFGGIRRQVGHLVKHWRGVWKRVKRSNEPFFPPRTLYYVSRLRDSGMRLSTLTARTAMLDLTAGATCGTPEEDLSSTRI